MVVKYDHTNAFKEILLKFQLLRKRGTGERGRKERGEERALI